MPDAQITLFDTLPADLVLPRATAPSVVYEECNRREGHLRIDCERGCYVFLNLGSVVTFGEFSGPTAELDADQLRVLGDYCHRMAERIENR